VTDDSGKILGIITDGDLRRMLEKADSFDRLVAADIMGKHPKTITSGELAVNALDRMRRENISQLIVSENGNYAGIIHLHDLVKEGII
jgi:arabinose-5-phosphate isomerase